PSTPRWRACLRDARYHPTRRASPGEHTEVLRELPDLGREQVNRPYEDSHRQHDLHRPRTLLLARAAAVRFGRLRSWRGPWGRRTRRSPRRGAVGRRELPGASHLAPGRRHLMVSGGPGRVVTRP